MSYNFGNRTVKNGLVFYLDVENRLSYIPNNTEWKSIAKDTSVGIFNSSYPPVFTNSLYNTGKKAIDFSGILKETVVGQIGIDRLLDINKTGTITVQIYFAVENLEQEKFIFMAGQKELSNSYYPQYAVGVSEYPPDDSIWVYVYHGGTFSRFSTRGIAQRKIFACMTVSFGASTGVYINDTYLGAHGITPFVPEMQGDYWVVGWNPTRDLYYDGAVNAIRVYNRELTAVEVAESYNFFTQRS